MTKLLLLTKQNEEKVYFETIKNVICFLYDNTVYQHS